MINEVHLMDCLEGMKQWPDKHFDLAVVDPPYDFSCSKTTYVNKNKVFAKRFNRHGIGLKDKGGLAIGGNNLNSLGFPPQKEYFTELIRVSKNQIIWGGNTFANLLPNSMEWLFWDKKNGDSYFSDGELAWTSFSGGVRMFRPDHLPKADKIHPTQKPVKLYDWIFHNYAKEGDTILDTHVGSGSSRISAHRAGLDFTGYELDPDYWAAQEKRYNQFKSQLTLF